MTSDNDNNGVINFVDIKLKALEKGLKEGAAREPSNEEMIDIGIQDFTTALNEGVSGFLSIIFSGDDTPSIIMAGDIDPFKTIGVLKLCEQEIMNNMIYANLTSGTDVEIVPVPENPEDGKKD